MLYHYYGRAIGPLDAGAPLARLGIYAVASFYVLSGVSLALVYRNGISTQRDVRRFFLKRVFRIAPLYWIVATLFLVRHIIVEKQVVDPELWMTIALNFSLTFGFVRPWDYLTTGAWSIGNEVVFYSFFPFVLFVRERKFLLLIVAAVVSAIAAGWFAFVELDPRERLSSQWDLYVHPFNQAHLFVAGCAIGQTFVQHARLGPGIAITTSFLILGAFFAWPVSGDMIALTTGWNRVVFSLMVTCFVVVCLYWRPELRGWRHKILEALGAGCYSIYLLHPLAVFPARRICERLGLGISCSFLLAVIFTFLASWISYRFVETPAMRLGRRFAASDRSTHVA